MLTDFIHQSILVLKILAFIGFFVMGVFFVGVSYRVYINILKEDELIDKYKYVFVVYSILLFLILMFLYALFFIDGYLQHFIK
jgi:hypothetical protein